MAVLVLGLLLFLGVHSTRVFAEGARRRWIAGMGEMPYKGLYSVVSLVGFVLIVWGYGLARQQPVLLWMPPRAMNHVAALLMLFSFVLLVAAYVPRNAIKARLHHPMVLGVKTWAFAHLLANGTLADVVLFGAFLLWAVLNFRAARRRDRTDNVHYAPGTAAGTAATVAVGLLAYGAFAFWGHAWLIGVRPF
ncbi:NnrU family protein [Ramlibacter tataouinensis]|uniref:NnrU family protein n=1 Tax=Ramlibacter tataouinensis TaxID=94132 RepID=UPI0022F400AC|nr:NnrU family protein [Ramlibacter tataouinensis]WBY00039.1 NnrU family protein [Ramlibacter tataouinensis]